jgi:polyhydroxyalkanoate synthesis regulator phasin
MTRTETYEVPKDMFDDLVECIEIAKRSFIAAKERIAELEAEVRQLEEENEQMASAFPDD